GDRDDVGRPGLGVVHDRGARRLVGGVGETRAGTGAGRDQPVVAQPDQPGGGRRGGGHERPVVVRNSDAHVTLLAHVRNLPSATDGPGTAGGYADSTVGSNVTGRRVGRRIHRAWSQAISPAGTRST